MSKEYLLEFKSPHHRDLFQNDADSSLSNKDIVKALKGKSKFVVVCTNENGVEKYRIAGMLNTNGMFIWPREVEKYFRKLPYLQEEIVEELPAGFNVRTEKKLVINDLEVTETNYKFVIDNIKKVFE